MKLDEKIEALKVNIKKEHDGAKSKDLVLYWVYVNGWWGK